MLQELCEEVRSEFPKFRIARKDESRMMRTANAALLVLTAWRMKEFMTQFVTTVGQTVYVPASWDSWSELTRSVIVRHERVHMRQARRYGFFLFAVAYLLLPLPMGLAWCRARLEMEAYAETIRATVMGSGTARVLTPEYRQQMVDHFITSQYGWAWPFRKQVEGWVQKAVDDAIREYVSQGS